MKKKKCKDVKGEEKSSPFYQMAIGLFPNKVIEDKRRKKPKYKVDYLKTKEQENTAVIEIKGRFNNIVSYAEDMDEATQKMLENIAGLEYLQGAKIRIMPDAHAGKGCAIGTTMTISGKVSPNMVGVDIGCGMHVVRLAQKEIDFKRLDKVIRERIPSGYAIRDHKNIHPLAKKIHIEELACAKYVDIPRAYQSIGTLGGGNHFIELDRSSNGDIYLIIHSGSRHLGLEVAGYYQKEGFARMQGESKRLRKEIIGKYRAEGREKEIDSVLAALKAEKGKYAGIKEEFAFVEGELFNEYIHDMHLTQNFAKLNRRAMAEEIIAKMNWKPLDEFITVHNYIDIDEMILRKGAVAAHKGEKFLVPLNMRDGSLICIGKGNEEWNQSAPHGAGRLMSRNQARQNLDLSAYQAAMDGIYTTSVNRETLDEAPMAYKPAEYIINAIEPTAEVINVIKPIYNFKAAEAEPYRKRARK